MNTIKEAQPPDPQSKRRLGNRVFLKYCLVLGALLLGTAVLLVGPLWMVHPPYGKAFLLSWPPTILCALSWMTGAWWAWDKDRWMLMAVTMGAIPVRLALMLGWVWLVVSIPGVPVLAFFLGMMWHWAVFSVPELAMLVELSRNDKGVRPQ